MSHPTIIQGGMGVGVSGWVLARAVSKMGQLGVVSGTALDVVLSRRLQSGDPGGHMRRAFNHFPFPEIADRVWKQHFIEGGKPESAPFRNVLLQSLQSPQSLTELTVLANFSEVYLATEGHNGVVGINFLEKIQSPTLPSLFGAMLAGVDYVLMGAGIPRSIPGILDRLAEGKDVSLKLDVQGTAPGEEFFCTFDPQLFCRGQVPALRRPRFLAIVSSATLAITLARKSSGHVNGFIVEGASAGGHNAPPRGTMQLSEKGEPIYGARDIVDLDKIRELKLPFWLAGSFGAPGKLSEALRLGAVGVQAGTAFAFCDESGINTDLKHQVVEGSRLGTLEVYTDPVASPTGFPFKVVSMDGSISDSRVYTERNRVCDLGYLRHAYRKTDGTVGFRCPGEPVSNYVRKGGEECETAGRKCICNGLFATIGLPQVRSGEGAEAPLLTAGDEVSRVAQFLRPGKNSYSARDVIEALLAPSGHPANHHHPQTGELGPV